METSGVWYVKVFKLWTSNMQFMYTVDSLHLEVTCKYCTILYKMIEHLWILLYAGSPGTNPPGILRDDYINKAVKKKKKK